MLFRSLDHCTEQTLVLACISGGASALVVAPRDWSAINQLLINPSTAAINHEIKQLIRAALPVNPSILLLSIPKQLSRCWHFKQLVRHY